MDPPPRIGSQVHRPQSHQPASRLYKHTPLKDSGQQIRVLQFLPSDEPGIIHATLKVHDLVDKPYYIALSYEWGEHNHETEVGITIDNEKFFIGRNLWVFFDHLRTRRTDRLTLDRFRFWVDAICIQQDDLREKAAQINILSRIFGQADHALAWLGWTTAFNVPKTFDFVRALSFRINSDRSFETACSVGLVPDKQGEAVYGKIKTSDAWRAVHKLCRLSYWSRRWIIQEVTFARKLVLVCDGNEISWAVMQRMFDFMQANLAILKNRSLDHFPGVHPNWVRTLQALQRTNAWKIFHFQTRMRPMGNGVSLEMLTTFFASFKCHLLHDQIYSLLNLAKERSRMNIQYSRSTFELFASVFSSIQEMPDRDWPKRLMRELSLDKDPTPLPQPSHLPIVPMRVVPQDFLCISHVFHSSEKNYLRDLSKSGQATQAELGTKELFRQYYHMSEFRKQRIDWRENIILRGSTQQLLDVRHWSSVVSLWKSSLMDKILKIVRNIEDTCPTSISGARLVILNNGGLAFVAGSALSGDVLVPLPRTTFALLMRMTDQNIMSSVGIAALGPKSGKGWPDLVSNWHNSLKIRPGRHLRREEDLKDDGSLTLYLDAAVFVELYRYKSPDVMRSTDVTT